jgi:hypothetical protein
MSKNAFEFKMLQGAGQGTLKWLIMRVYQISRKKKRYLRSLAIRHSI